MVGRLALGRNHRCIVGKWKRGSVLFLKLGKIKQMSGITPSSSCAAFLFLPHHSSSLSLSASLQFCFNSLPFIGVAVPQTASPHRRGKKKKKRVNSVSDSIWLSNIFTSSSSPIHPVPPSPYPSICPSPPFLLRILLCFSQPKDEKHQTDTWRLSGPARCPITGQIISALVSAAISLSLLIVAFSIKHGAHCVPDKLIIHNLTWKPQSTAAAWGRLWRRCPLSTSFNWAFATRAIVSLQICDLCAYLCLCVCRENWNIWVRFYWKG